MQVTAESGDVWKRRLCARKSAGTANAGGGSDSRRGLDVEGVMLHLSFTTEKSWGPANSGNPVFENDPSVLGALFVDPNAATLTLARSYIDRAYLGKGEAAYRFPSKWGGWEMANVAD